MNLEREFRRAVAAYRLNNITDIEELRAMAQSLLKEVNSLEDQIYENLLQQIVEAQQMHPHFAEVAEQSAVEIPEEFSELF